MTLSPDVLSALQKAYAGGVISVVGGYAGDEAKGAILQALLDALAPAFPKHQKPVVVRHQGGGNAGHTLIGGGKKFVASLLPSGVVVPNTDNVIGPGVALNPWKLMEEAQRLQSTGFDEPKLLVSNLCQLVLPWHIALDEARERSSNSFGSTKQGIAPFYAQVAMKTGIQVGAIFSNDLQQLVERAAEEANVILRHQYGAEEIDPNTVVTMLQDEALRNFLRDKLVDSTAFLHRARDNKRTIVYENQLGWMRDVFHGQFPFATSSQVLAGVAATCAGIQPQQVIMVAKAYTSMVGTGTMVTAIQEPEEAEELRLKGGEKGEFGAVTGRPRDVGWIDIPALRRGAMLHGATEVALTCLDVLGELDRDKIPVCVRYEVDGKSFDGWENFPEPWKVPRAEPVFIELPNWKVSKEEIRKCTSFEELPDAAKSFVRVVETELRLPINLIKHGPDSSNFLVRL
jgi:adenylosuccinate synthase